MTAERHGLINVSLSWDTHIGEFNDINNRRYEYPVMMQSKDGKIHAAYSFGNRRCVKYVCVDETWIRGEKMLPGAEGDPGMPCQR